MLLTQLLRQIDDILRLGLVHTDGTDQLDDVLLVRRGQRLRVRILPEQPRRHLVHADIGRLGRQHDRHQQFKCIYMLQRAAGLRVFRPQQIQHLRDLSLCESLFLFCHFNDLPA